MQFYVKPNCGRHQSNSESRITKNPGREDTVVIIPGRSYGPGELIDSDLPLADLFPDKIAVYVPPVALHPVATAPAVNPTSSSPGTPSAGPATSSAASESEEVDETGPGSAGYANVTEKYEGAAEKELVVWKKGKEHIVVSAHDETIQYNPDPLMNKAAVEEFIDNFKGPPAASSAPANTVEGTDAK